MSDDRFLIGELAERTGLGRDTIRYYESLGVLPEAPRNEAGYRLYDQVDPPERPIALLWRRTVEDVGLHARPRAW